MSDDLSSTIHQKGLPLRFRLVPAVLLIVLSAIPVMLFGFSHPALGWNTTTTTSCPTTTEVVTSTSASSSTTSSSVPTSTTSSAVPTSTSSGTTSPPSTTEPSSTSSSAVTSTTAEATPTSANLIAVSIETQQSGEAQLPQQLPFTGGPPVALLVTIACLMITAGIYIVRKWATD